jgi:hypothetical protein
MIAPAYSLTATERVLPSVTFDFSLESLDPRITFSRASVANYTNSAGAITSAAIDVPRFDYDPVTLLPKGLLLEEGRTNLLLNSAALSTQNVTVTATAYTLSFYGTGQVVLSGTASATVTGTGAYPTRTFLTFTPTAGTLTLTVTGTVEYAQLEAGSYATSWITTTSGSAARSADVASITGTNFSSWFNASQGAFVVDFTYNRKLGQIRLVSLNDGTTSNYLEIVGASGAATSTGQGVYWNGAVSGGTTVNSNNAGMLSAAVNQRRIFAGAYKLDDFANSTNSGAIGSDTSSPVPVVNQLVFQGVFGSSQIISGCIKKLMYFPQRLTNAELQAFSKT